LLQVFVPMVAYIVTVPWLGLYLGSALFIAGFMWWHGGYRWRALPTGIAVCAVFYVLLEVWFQVDLYKGPVLDWLLALRG
jgi:putative tricarboxylic transport membrane protein